LINILHNYAAFEISTIDSFTHRILRTFAKDLNIPVNFEVEIETDEILEEAVDRLIAKVGKDKLLTRALIDFALKKADEDRSWDISKDLNKIAKLLVQENNLPYIQQLKTKTGKDFARFENDLRDSVLGEKKLLADRGEQFFKLIQEKGLDKKNFSRGSVPNYFDKLRRGELRTLPPKKKPSWAKNIAT